MTTFDASNPEDFALFGLTNAQLRRKGLSDAAITALRSTQHAAPPATSAAEVKAARGQQKPAQRVAPAKAKPRARTLKRAA
jgi:hypothetical protein